VLLVDTSLWIEVFKRSPSFDLTRVAAPDEWVVCLPIVQEVLQGFRDDGAYRIARDAMLAMPMVEAPLEESLFLEAADLFRVARKSGKTIRSATDCLIAACAIRHDLVVLHHDRDFARLSEVSALRARDPIAN